MPAAPVSQPIANPQPGPVIPMPVPQPVPVAGQVAIPHDTRHLPRGVAPSIVRAASRAAKDDRVELMLDPLELGKVKFDFTTTNDRMQINLSVERADTLDLLRRHADVLRAEFRDAGFEGSSLSFSQWSHQGPKDQAAQSLFPDAEGDSFTSPPPVSAPKRSLTSAGQGLDLRL